MNPENINKERNESLNSEKKSEVEKNRERFIKEQLGKSVSVSRLKLTNLVKKLLVKLTGISPQDKNFAYMCFGVILLHYEKIILQKKYDFIMENCDGLLQEEKINTQEFFDEFYKYFQDEIDKAYASNKVEDKEIMDVIQNPLLIMLMDIVNNYFKNRLNIK